MREILFRGKRKDNGEWVKGSFWDEIPGKLGGIAQYGSCVFHHIDLETVGQFTGLIDKNGAKVFDGDIVKVLQGKDKGVAYVGFENGSFMLYPRTGNIYERTMWAYWYNDWDVEIIGNIHDNPELLKNP